MPISVTVPLLKGGNIKDGIVSLLAQEWPLTARQLHQRLTSSGRQSTYQAVHKALKQLLTQDVLTKSGNKYLLSPTWLKQVKELSQRLEMQYAESAVSERGTKPVTEAFIFDSLIEALYALLNRMHTSYVTSAEPDLTVAHWRHVWPITCLSKREYDQLTEIMRKGKHYGICAGATPLDRMLAGMWRGLGKKLRLGVPCAEACDILVTRDAIAQIYFPPKLGQELHKLYQNTQKVRSETLSELYHKVYKSQEKVRVIITHEKELADQLRQQTLAHFEHNDMALDLKKMKQ